MRVRIIGKKSNCRLNIVPQFSFSTIHFYIADVSSHKNRPFAESHINGFAVAYIILKISSPRIVNRAGESCFLGYFQVDAGFDIIKVFGLYGGICNFKTSFYPARTAKIVEYRWPETARIHYINTVVFVPFVLRRNPGT